MIEGLILFVTCALETALCIYYYDSFTLYKWSKLYKIITFLVLTGFVVGNAVLFDVIPSEYYSIKLLTYIIIHMIFVKICYQACWIMSVFFSSSAILLQILIQTVVSVLFKISKGNDPVFVNLLCWLACFMTLCLELFLRKKLPLIKEYLKKDSAILTHYIWLPLVTAIAGLFSYVFFISPSDLGLFQIVISAVLLVVNIGAMFILQESLVKDERLRLSEIQLESKQNQLQAFRDMQTLYERQGQKLHDYKKQLTTLQELLKGGDMETAIEFTEQLTKSIAVEMSEVNVGHPVVNAVLNQQYRVAKGKNIGMTFAVSDLHDIRLSDDEIVVLLGNLIENAIHECEKVILQGQAASIQVKFVEKDSRLVLTVRNPVVLRVDITDNKIQGVQKDGHGIGLSNVENVVEKYGGTFAISCDEKEFTAVAMI